MTQAIRDLPRVIPYRDKAPVLPGYHLEGRPDLFMTLAGVGGFAIFYGAIAGMGDTALIPVAGPFVVMTQMQGVPSAFAFFIAFGAAFFVVDGVMQAASVGLIIAGLAKSDRVQVRDEPAWEIRGPRLRVDARGPALVF